MSIRLVVSRGYGNGNYDGTIGDVVTRGYGPGAQARSGSVGGHDADRWWEEIEDQDLKDISDIVSDLARHFI